MRPPRVSSRCHTTFADTVRRVASRCRLIPSLTAQICCPQPAQRANAPIFCLNSPGIVQSRRIPDVSRSYSAPLLTLYGYLHESYDCMTPSCCVQHTTRVHPMLGSEVLACTPLFMINKHANLRAYLGHRRHVTAQAATPWSSSIVTTIPLSTARAPDRPLQSLACNTIDVSRVPPHV